MSKDREEGYVVCRAHRGGLVRGKTVRGEAHSVSIPIKCPPETEIVALHHNHPSGNINLSRQDIETAREHRIPAICVKVGRNGKSRTKCYRVK